MPKTAEAYHPISFTKEEASRWILSMLGATLLFSLVAFFIQNVYHPSVTERLDLAKRLLLLYDNAHPKPMETMLFRAGVVTMPLGMLLFYRLLAANSLAKYLAKTPFFWLVSAICVAGIIALLYFGFAATNIYPDPGSDMAGQSYFGYYFGGFAIERYFWLYTFVIFPAVCLFFIGLGKYNWEQKKLYNLIISGIGYSLALWLMAAIVIINTFHFPYSWEQKNDFTAVYYSVTQVFAGIPMLVDGFTNTYGLYPHFLLPIFKLTGLSIFNFSLVMSLLLVFAFVCNFIFLKRFVRNKFILFSGFFTLIFFSYLSFRLATPFDSIFAFYPIRFIIGATLLVLAGSYFASGSVKLYWFIFLLMALALLWNPEFGIVAYLSWLFANIYHDWYDQKGVIQLKKTGFHLLAAAAMLIAAFSIWKLVIYAFYHKWPEMSLLFSPISVFENAGMNLMPMALVHPWNFAVLIVCIGFLYAIVKWSRKQVTPKATIIFLLALISLGGLFYFQGESRNWTFCAAASYSIILLTVLGDELWQQSRLHNLLLFKVVFSIFLFIVSFSFFEIAFDSNRIYDLFYQQNEKDKQSNEQGFYEDNLAFFLSKTAENQKVHIISARKFPGLYFDGSKRISAFNPGLQDMFLNSDLNRLENNLRDSSFDIFLEPYNLAHMPFLSRPMAIIGATYQCAGVGRRMFQLVKRKNALPTQIFFTDTNKVALHRKYTDDTAGVNMRANDAEGTEPVSLNSEFSIQALFYPDVQAFPFVTVVGNKIDSNGFMLGAVSNSPDYIFGVCGQTYNVPAQLNKWMYCTINVFPDHLDIYENSDLIITAPLPRPMPPYSGPLSIGNLGYMHYFFGPIAEIELANKIIDKNQIQDTWQNISHVVK